MSELPPGWAETRLDELADVRLGRQRSPKNHTGARMRPYLRAANITWKGLDLKDVKDMNFSEHESDVYELLPGDVLVAEASGSASEVGKPAIWRGAIDGCCFQNTLVRVRSRGHVPEYLRYFLLGEARSGRLGQAAPGVGIHHIGATRLSAWKVAVPPLNEQRRIVAAIEEQFSRLDAAEESLRTAAMKLGVLRRASLGAAFAGKWPLVKLAELTDSQRPICYGILKPKTTGDLTVPYVEVRSIRNGFIDVASLHRTTETLHQEFRRSELRSGDVVLAIRGSFDRAAVVPASLAGANVSRDVARIAPTDALDSQYLAHLLESPVAFSYFARAARGVAVRGVNIGDLRTMPIPAPPVEEQRLIAAEVDRQLSLIGAMSVAIEAARRRSAALRRSILERSFRGEFVPQDPSDEPASVLLERIAAERAHVEPRGTGRRVHTSR
jgi:type I restriction enzyme S subunit